MNFDEWFASFDAEGMLPMALLRKAFNDATTAEREECAKVCESVAAKPSSLWEESGCWAHSAENCTTAIRARSEK